MYFDDQAFIIKTWTSSVQKRMKIQMHKGNSGRRGPQLTRSEVHGYWSAPDPVNSPNTYLHRGLGRSLFLLSNICRYATARSRILEIGCNSGRNLAMLWHGGFRNIEGIEINPAAIDNLRGALPELRRVPIRCARAEDALPGIADDIYDVVFTVAVLEHIHWDSSFVFSEIARIANRVIVIEDEHTVSERHFPRNYRQVFEAVGMNQIDFIEKVPDLPKTFHLRAFDKRAVKSPKSMDASSPLAKLGIPDEPDDRALEEKLLAVLNSTFPKGSDGVPPLARQVAAQSGASLQFVQMAQRLFVAAGWASSVVNDQCYPNAGDGASDPRDIAADLARYLSKRWAS